ncbi:MULTISPECIES: hypothetical protein [Nostocales]|uniref:Outer membrane protein beta-barrel domain-containing protein n=3 Tax=Nostocales TaxID=1161 RepID=A0A0C1R4P5_9CYAN|nr:hypothetical protein [Tolypothrix bouteillei]KAF3889224.1 hypothetical protein DA73_0400029895 [Tolypothrix bouteillei VB521301]
MYFSYVPAQTTVTAAEVRTQMPVASAPALTVAQYQPVQQTPTAKKLGLTGDYIGVGINPGVTSGGRSDEKADLGGDVTARIAIPKTQLSVRPSAIISRHSADLVPTVTYDLPIAKNTNLFGGGGYSFVTDRGKDTPLGNKNAPIITGGVETKISKSVNAYAATDLAFDAYRNSSAEAVGFQVGVGYNF